MSAMVHAPDTAQDEERRLSAARRLSKATVRQHWTQDPANSQFRHRCGRFCPQDAERAQSHTSMLETKPQALNACEQALGVAHANFTLAAPRDIGDDRPLCRY